MMAMEKGFRLRGSDFYQVFELLRKLNLPVPQIYQDFSSEGAVLLQDIGETHLCDLVREETSTDVIEELYSQAINHLVTLQTRAPHYSTGIRAFRKAFDERKLMWELSFMMKHFAAGFAGYRPGRSALIVLKTFFKELVKQIAALPRVFCHRDYHSQNLMLWNERLYILDFQDARMGPHVYDIVSLLGDSYVDIGSSRSRLLRYYAERHPDFSEIDVTGLQEQYSLMALQRHLKHLGTFGYLYVKGDPSSLQYVPLTISYLEGNLSKFNETRESAEVLAELFDLAREKLNSME
jgi:hypothetical protein